MALKAPVSAFCLASVDTFPVKAPLLGDLTHIKLSHNARGANPDWLVETVRIVHVELQQEWLFFGHVWLHSGNGNQVTLTPGQLLIACMSCCVMLYMLCMSPGFCLAMCGCNGKQFTPMPGQRLTAYMLTCACCAFQGAIDLIR